MAHDDTGCNTAQAPRFFSILEKTVAPIDLQTKQMRKQLAKRLRDWFQCSTGVGA
jgi:hypothetical protein